MLNMLQAVITTADTHQAVYTTKFGQGLSLSVGAEIDLANIVEEKHFRLHFSFVEVVASPSHRSEMERDLGTSPGLRPDLVQGKPLYL